jgi:hypothetical protein
MLDGRDASRFSAVCAAIDELDTRVKEIERFKDKPVIVSAGLSNCLKIGIDFTPRV